MEAQVLAHRVQNAVRGRLDGSVQGAAAGVFMAAAAKLLGYMSDSNRTLAA